MTVVDADRPVPEPVPAVNDPVLDNPAWSALVGAHAHLAEGGELARRYPADVSPFAAVRTWDDPGVWDAVIELVGYDAEFPGPPESVALPPGWVRGEPFEGVQLVETERLHGRADDEAVLLGARHQVQHLGDVGGAQPGPFLPRTYLLGRYVGIRRDGRLAAMAGERLRPAGWTEISAVATDERYRGQGLATRLVLDVVHHVHRRGDRAMLHASAANTNAIGLYEHLGFTLRRRMAFGSVRTPATPAEQLGPAGAADAQVSG
jgi:ribosomal protein S18 acetylase RimI-like enzyme